MGADLAAVNWHKHFSQATRYMKRSAVRELLKVTAQPEMISFAGGLPAPELFPVETLGKAAETVLLSHGSAALQYGAAEGVAELRDWVADRFSRSGLPVRRANVLIVSGGQQALDLIGRVLLNAGDRVVVESPTYLALLSAWRPLGVKFLSIPSDADGMQIDALPGLLAQQPKLIYAVPNFQNPQGTTLSQARRRRLVQWLREHQIPLVEDDPYGDLRYSGSPIPRLLDLGGSVGSEGPTLPSPRPPTPDTQTPDTQTLDTQTLDTPIIYVGTVSKILVPGLRVGWVIAAEEVVEKLVQAKQACDLHTSTFSQLMVAEWLRSGLLEPHLAILRDAYRQRRDAMLHALETFFPPEATWTRPEGGMFLLVTLPKDCDAKELLAEAIQQKVVFVPGEEFHVEGEGRNTLRLNFSHATPDRIYEGIERLGRLLRRKKRSAVGDDCATLPVDGKQHVHTLLDQRPGDRTRTDSPTL